MSDQEISNKPRAIDGIGAKFTYYTSILSVYLLFGVLFFYSGKSKLFDGLGAPEGIAKQFSGTFLETIPGVDAAWTIVGIMEFLVFLLTLASLLTLEFLPTKRKPILFSALGLSMLTFTFLSVGENATGEHESVASLFLYAVGTAVVVLFLRKLPPYGSLTGDD